MNFGTRILVTRTLSATTTFINNLRGAYYCWIFQSQYRKNILEQSIKILSGIDWDWVIEPNRISGSRLSYIRRNLLEEHQVKDLVENVYNSRIDAVKIDFTIEK